MVDHKTPIPDVNATPVKHVIYSIISDYNLKTGLCELVDNAVDQWSDKKFAGNLTVELDLEADRQIISVRDNAGGVSVDNLPLLIAPGKSRNDPGAELIGIFGVGGKRSVIALAENTEIKTRFGDQQTHELDITRDWLAAPTWQIPAYAIPDIDPNTTLVKMSCLRRTFTEADVDAIRVHLGQTYDWFISKGCVIKLNGEPVAPINFEDWAYPPDYSPHQTKFPVDVPGAGHFTCEITSGLIRDRIPEESNYGVYFYCNHRLIEKEVKNRPVGYYVTAEAGVPHPDSSLCRTIVRLDGPAKGMPWTSNKSQLNYDHPVFKAISKKVIELTACFSKLSRRLKDDWNGQVIRYDTGKIVPTQTTETQTGTRMILPDLPKQSREHGTRQKKKNKAQIHNDPWMLGLVEAIDAVEIIERSPLGTKNRISLILLDSNFEIALKEFIVHRKDLFPPNEFKEARLVNLFRNRTEVIKTVTSKIRISQQDINLANHYYELRNKLIHERATVDVRDDDIRKYRSVVESVLHTLFNLEFE